MWPVLLKMKSQAQLKLKIKFTQRTGNVECTFGHGGTDQPSLETIFYIQTQTQVDINKQTSLYSKLTDVFIGSHVLISTMCLKLPVY